MYGLSWNPNLPFEHVRKHPEWFDENSWSVFRLTINPNLPWNYVEKYPKGLFEKFIESSNYPKIPIFRSIM